MQHPHAIGGDMDDNTAASKNSRDSSKAATSLTPADRSARFRLIYDDLSSYCDKMWANIAAMRGRAMEHAILSASLLGLHLAFVAASDYKIGWWSLTGILILTATTLPHLILVVSITQLPEFHLSTKHAETPVGESERLIISAKEATAKALDKKSATIVNLYQIARNFWFIGATMSILLGLVEYLI